MSKARIVAIATRSPGHLDFGGGGFTRVAGALQRLGHDVHWLSYGRSAARLTALGHTTHVAPELEAARQVGRGREPLAMVEQIAAACRALSVWLRDLKPSLVLIDRLNGLCGLVAQSLDLPFVAMGTPGGYWTIDSKGVAPVGAPLPVFEELAAALRRNLGWARGDLSSYWLRSDLLNITFLGRTFYPPAEPPDRVAHVNLFESLERRADAMSLGIVLGNSGALSRMTAAVSALLGSGAVPGDMSIEVVAGGREDGPEIDGLLRLLSTHRVRRHAWVEYEEIFRRLGRVVAFGGVGAIWRAVNHRLPILVVDGGTGDQRWNGEAVERLGLGAVFRLEAQALSASYAQLADAPRHARALDVFCAPSNYSDSLDSVADRVARLVQ